MQPLPSPDNDLDFGTPAGQNPAQGFQATEQIRGAVLRFLEAGAIDEAASLIASSGAEVGDALLDLKDLAPQPREALAEAFHRARDFDRAARAAERLDNPERAAHYLELSGQFARAGAIRERLNQLEQAAELHQRAGDHERAGDLFTRVGRLDRAAEAFERGNRLYEAGRLWSRQRRLDRALEVLQRVDSDDSTFVPAMHLLGRILEFTGHTDAAIARYQEVVHARPLDNTTVDIHERLIGLYVQTSNVPEARRLITKVLKFEPSRPYPARALGLLLGKGSTEATMRSVISMPPPPASAVMSGQPITVTAVNPTIDRLRQLPLFSELSLSELRQLHAAGEFFPYRAEELLIEQDREGAFFFVLLSGSVLVSHLADGREIPLTELRQSACVGEMSLLDEGPTSARVRALTPTETFRWPLGRLRAFLADDDRIALRILRVMSRAMSVRLRDVDRRVR